jgi:hypothetical protein
MIAKDWNEVIWDFRWSQAQLQRGTLGMLATDNDDSLFARRGDRPRSIVDVELPHPFMDTAMMTADGWQRRPLAQEHALRLGRQMWASLPAELQAPLFAATDVAHPFRLRINSTGSGVDEIPWEWLTMNHQRSFALDPAVRLLRSVPVPYPEPPLTVEPPLRVLLMTTNPRDESLLQAWVELDAIRAGLNDGGYAIRVLDETTRDALVRALADEPHIVHYVGHAAVGQGSGYLILNDRSGGSLWLSAAELARLLPPSVRLLCLSTCFTAPNYNVAGLPRLGHAAADLHLPTALVNQYAVTQEGARAFWRRFYPTLLETAGDAVEAAHRARLDTVQASPSTADWASYSLILRDRIGRPFRFDDAGVNNADRFASEIQAQFSARLASELAMRVNELGGNVSDSLKRGQEKVFAQLSELQKKID